MDAKTRFLDVIWSYTLERDNEKPDFFGYCASWTDFCHLLRQKNWLNVLRISADVTVVSCQQPGLTVSHRNRIYSPEFSSNCISIHAVNSLNCSVWRLAAVELSCSRDVTRQAGQVPEPAVSVNQVLALLEV